MTRKILTFLFIGLIVGTASGFGFAEKQKFDNNRVSSFGRIANLILNQSVTLKKDYEHATYFFVIADTGQDYFQLYQKMFDLNKSLSIPIDTMGRSYNVEKDLIALAEDDEDEMYAGQYFPRRYPGESLSLEYFNFYEQDADDKTIALMAGIFESKKDAHLMLSVLKQTEKNAFIYKTEIYIGCTH